MTTTRFDDLDDLAKAGFIVALIGGLLAVVPQLERLLAAGPGWGEPLTLALLSLGLFAALLAAVRGWTALGGALSGAFGLVIGILGPTTPGVLAMLGGTLIWVAAGKERAEEAKRAEPTAATEF